MNFLARDPSSSGPLGGPHLQPEQLDRYRREGFLAPVPVMPPELAALYRAQYEAFVDDFGGQLPPHYKHKLHLMLPWVSDLVHLPAVLDRVESILGPDFLCWTTNFLIKESGAGSFVSFHQDSRYWGLTPPEVVTAWIALSPSTSESGCVEVVPGSHLEAERTHVDTFAAGNMLTRGQEIEGGVDPDSVVAMELAPGEMSLHHIQLIHGSGVNRSADRRIGLAVRYMSTRVRKAGHRESALLVRGQDEHGHFDLERDPGGRYDSLGRRAHNRAVKLQIRGGYDSDQSTPLGVRLRLWAKRLLLSAALDVMYLGLSLGLGRGRTAPKDRRVGGGLST